MNREEIKRIFEVQGKLFDIVRLVDPGLNEQYVLDGDGQLVLRPYKCYECFERDGQCDNCISCLVLEEKRRMTKFEIVGEDMFFILADYVELEGAPYVMELVLRLDDDTLFGAYDKAAFISTIDEHSSKLYTDALTGAYNRLYYEEQMENLENVTAVAMMDVDDFKQVNDLYGHAVGDEVLVKVVQAMFACVRSTDAVIRYGGDEFLIAFPKMPRAALEGRLENLRRSVERLKSGEDGQVRVSLSIGAIYSPTSALKYIVDADRCMYKAKEKKNFIVIEDHE